MFTVTSEPTFTHTVAIFTPVDGGHREESVKATYRVISTDRAAEFGNSEAGNGQFLRAVLVRLDDLVDEHKKPISYSDELRDQLIGIPHVRLGLMRGYLEAVGKAKTGN